MEWWDFLSAFLLGVGLVMGRFRRKDKGKPLNAPGRGPAGTPQGTPQGAPQGAAAGGRGAPRGKLGMGAAFTLLASSLLGMLTVVGGWSASLGGWLAVSFILAALVLTTSSGMLGAGVWLDLKDGIPDKRTLMACIFGPQILMIALGAFLGPQIHDLMVNKVKEGQTAIVAAITKASQGDR